MTSEKTWINRIKNMNNPTIKNTLSIEKFHGYYIITDGEFKGAFIYLVNDILPLINGLSPKEIQNFKERTLKNVEWF